MARKILLFVSTMLLFISCDKRPEVQTNEEIGTVSFSFTDENINEETANDAIPNAILIKIADANGINIIDQKLALTNFENTYITNNIQLIQGNYTITLFNILNEENVVIYTSPIENSDLAESINDPLPIKFSVIETENIIIFPEVIFVGPTIP